MKSKKFPLHCPMTIRLLECIVLKGEIFHLSIPDPIFM
jgi:hypothetical protein